MWEVSGEMHIAADIVDSEDWFIAKSLGDGERFYSYEEKADAARRIAESSFTCETSFAPGMAFVPVPSSSGSNVIPMVLSAILAERYKGTALEAGYCLSTVQAKYANPLEAHYLPREYEIAVVPAAPVVVVEDIIVSGASAKGFIDALIRSGARVAGLATLLGNADILPSWGELAKLCDACAAIGLEDEGQILARIVTKRSVRHILKDIRAFQASLGYRLEQGGYLAPAAVRLLRGIDRLVQARKNSERIRTAIPEDMKTLITNLLFLAEAPAFFEGYASTRLAELWLKTADGLAPEASLEEIRAMRRLMSRGRLHSL